MSNYSVEVLINESFPYSRGAVFDQQTKHLYFVDAITGEVIKYNTVTKTIERRTVEANLCAAIPTDENDDHLLVVCNNKLYRYIWSSGELVTLHENKFSDVYMTANIDSKGRLWLGTMDMAFNNKAGVYCLQENGELVKKVDSKSEVFSIVWSPDNKQMYACDTGNVTIYVYDFNEETGEVSNEREWVSFAKRPEFQCPSDYQLSSIVSLPPEEMFDALSKHEMPAGMLMTKSGSIWVCCYHTGRIVLLNANDGSIDEQSTISALTPASMVYSDENGQEIVVLTISSYLSDEFKRKSPDIGKLFKVRKTDGSHFNSYSNAARFALKSLKF